MNKLNVLLLGWEFSPAIRQKQETSCYLIAQALAERVNLWVLLPHSNQDVFLPNVELTGLDQVDLNSIQSASSQARPLPYSNEAYIRNTISLYGSGDSFGPSEGYVKPLPSPEMGTSATFTKDKSGKIQEKGSAPANFFGCEDFKELSLDAQVIEYARYTSRWANQRKFDLIYAYNYRTFLAATELKLVTGKKLILQVDSLSYERINPNSKGWMYEVERQAFLKCDYILTNMVDRAEILVKEYDISPDKIESLEKKEGDTPSVFQESVEGKPDNFLNGNTIRPKNKAAKEIFMASEKKEANWQSTADAIEKAIQKVATA